MLQKQQQNETIILKTNTVQNAEYQNALQLEKNTSKTSSNTDVLIKLKIHYFSQYLCVLCC